MDKQLLLVNYHYVRDPAAYAYPGIHPIAPDAFRSQIERLAAEFYMATPEEVEDHILRGAALPQPSALITFDDGLVDHAEAAVEVLDPLGIKAAFFVCSRPLTEGRAITVHKVHFLRATTEPTQFRSEFMSKLPEDWRARQLSQEERQSARRTYVYDLPEHGELKFLINFVLPEEVIDTVTTGMLEDRGIDEAEFCRQTYMGGEALRALDAAGHKVGAHTHDHRPVTRLGFDEPRLMNLHVEALSRVVGRRPNWISYPYGRDWALPADPQVFCRRYGFDLGITLSGDWVDPECGPYAVTRINTNEVATVLARRGSALA